MLPILNVKMRQNIVIVFVLEILIVGKMNFENTFEIMNVC